MRAIHAVMLAFVCLQPSSAETPQVLNQRGVDLFRQGNYAGSQKALRQAIEQYKAADVLDVNGYAATLNNLAAALQTDGRVKEARTLLVEVISFDKQTTDQSEIVTHAINNLALLEQAEGEYSKAIALLQRALDRTPTTSASKAGTLHNLGAAYMDIGQYKKAREFLEASLQMHTQVGALRETPPTLAFLALLASRSKDESRAFVLLDRALKLRREIYGPVHPLVALSLNDIAELHSNLGRYEEAAALFEESLQIFEASVGTDHAYAAPVLYHFGTSRQLEGRHREALDLYGRAIYILETTFGPKHARLAVVYKAAALSAAKLKRKDDAKSYTVRAEAIEHGQVAYGRHTVDVSSFTRRF